MNDYGFNNSKLQSSGLRPRNEMAKKRRTRFSLKEDRQLIQMAATSATLEEAAAIFRTSVDTIEKKSKTARHPVATTPVERAIRWLGEGEIETAFEQGKMLR